MKIKSHLSGGDGARRACSSGVAHAGMRGPCPKKKGLGLLHRHLRVVNPHQRRLKHAPLLPVASAGLHSRSRRIAEVADSASSALGSPRPCNEKLLKDGRSKSLPSPAFAAWQKVGFWTKSWRAPASPEQLGAHRLATFAFVSAPGGPLGFLLAPWSGSSSRELGELGAAPAGPGIFGAANVTCSGRAYRSEARDAVAEEATSMDGVAWNTPCCASCS